MAWIRIRMDPELLLGSGFGTRKIQSWIRIRNKSFRIHNTAGKDHFFIVQINILILDWYFNIEVKFCFVFVLKNVLKSYDH